MEIVILRPLQHRGQECIGIYFEKHALLQSLIRKSAGAKWSKTNSCWYLMCTGENYLRLKTALENKAELEIEELRKYLLEKKQGNKLPAYPTNTHAGEFKKKSPQKTVPVQQTRLASPISKENNDALQKFRQMLTLKSYSLSTIRTYTNEFVQFLQTIKEKPASEFTTARIKDYMLYCAEKLKLSENTLHSKINALKFYYEQVLGREKFFWVYPVGLKKN